MSVIADAGEARNVNEKRERHFRIGASSGGLSSTRLVTISMPDQSVPQSLRKPATPTAISLSLAALMRQPKSNNVGRDASPFKIAQGLSPKELTSSILR